jgi:hypothetical protein
MMREVRGAEFKRETPAFDDPTIAPMALGLYNGHAFLGSSELD